MAWQQHHSSNSGGSSSSCCSRSLLMYCSLTAVVPALVITGFLGSGKTTLVQHLLATCG
jgi:predicted NACHT family NTPase